MAKYCENNGNLYENSAINEIKVGRGADLRVQAVGSGSFQIIGKLTANGTPKVLDMIKLSTFETTPTITDNDIYAGDVTGFYSISVQNVSGVDKIFATIYSD